MVFFSCDGCSEALKKNQVEKHGFKCRNATFSCLDCGQAFSRETFKNHVKCLTEDKKYGGKNYVEKENKGEAKQNRWVEQVQRAIENVREQGLKQLLEQIRGFDNIPRKETKFINFLQNSIKIRDRNLCVKAWNCISEQAKKMQQEAEKGKLIKNDGQDCQNGRDSLVDKEGTSHNNSKKVENRMDANDTNQKQGVATTSGVKKFKWKHAIKRALKESEDGQMKLKRLRNVVIESYLANGQPGENDADPKTIFNSKLHSLGLRIDGKMVQLS